MTGNSEEEIYGRVHSFESGGMVDGPGLRFVVFLQGCPLRCLYCHNPDSWKFNRGREMSASEVVREALKYRIWMDSSGGGLTLSGGEALAQPEFSKAIFGLCRSFGIHSALDTSGYGRPETVCPVIDAADLVLLDIKTANAALHKRLAGVEMDLPRATLEYCKKIHKPLWIRHVLVPGLTDLREDLELLLDLLKEVPCLEKFEILPFHKMGESKWEDEGLAYCLTDTPPPDPDFVHRMADWFRSEGIPVGAV